MLSDRFTRAFKVAAMVLVITAMICTFGMAGVSEAAFWAMLGVVSAVSLVFLLLYLRLERTVSAAASEDMSRRRLTERDSLDKFPAPAVICDREGIMQWCNEAFSDSIYAGDVFGAALSEIVNIDLSEVFERVGEIIEINSGNYRIKAMADGRHYYEDDPDSGLCLLYFEDISENIRLENANRELMRPRLSLDGEGAAADSSGDNFPMPSAAVDNGGIIRWYNRAFEEKLRWGNAVGKAFSGFMELDFAALEGEGGTEAEYNGTVWQITSKEAVSDRFPEGLRLLYFTDISELSAVRRDFAMSRSRVVIIVIDSYDELFSGVRDSEKERVTSRIGKLCERIFIERHKGILKKISSDRYFAIISEEALAAMEREQFRSVRNEARDITFNYTERYHVTLSIGIGRGGGSLRDCQQMAEDALKEAQLNGGDRVYIKNESGMTRYGDSAAQQDGKSNVKVSMFARDLTGLIEGADRVIIMGHRESDFDSVGSAAGLCGAVRVLGSECYVYVNRDSTKAMHVIGRIMENDSAADIFLWDEQAAAEMFTERSLLIIVDTHKLSLLDSKVIYEKASSFEKPHIVYIDHHIKEEPAIENAVLSLHYQYASSVCEMVTEVIRCLDLKEELHSYYADAMLAGIIQDTKSFVLKTDRRTFEAAAYLKKLGADTVKVKTLAAIPEETSIRRSKIVEEHEIYKRCAVSSTSEMSGMAAVAAAQAADEMLNIEGVDASFVMYFIGLPDGGKKVKISARSFQTTKMNVQNIMVTLGGGGHKEQAAAVVDADNFDDAKAMLFKAIDDYVNKIS